jgi:tetratricopeptide (TPR) repeat protein
MGRVILFRPRTDDPSGLLRVARERCGMQLDEFARALGQTVGRPQLSAGAVQTWERGEIAPPTEIVAAALELAARSPSTRSQLAAEPPQGGELAIGSSAAARDLRVRIAATRRIDSGLVELLRAHTNSFRLIDRQLGACVVFEQLVGHISQIENLWKHGRAPGTGPALAAAVAEASTLAGWQALDLGKTSTAWSYYELARHAAREAGDPSVLAHATAEQAYVLIDSGRHEEAIELVAAAKGQIQRLPPRLAAWLYSAEAEIRAIRAEATLAQRALELAAAQCPASPADVELPYLTLDVVHFERWRGCTLAYLGDPAAVRQLSEVVARIDRTFTRAAAGLHSDMAVALARAGERDEARHHMHRAQRLADMVGSARQRRRTHERAAALFGPTVPAC